MLLFSYYSFFQKIFGDSYMKKVVLFVIAASFLIPSNNADARWIDFGRWFGGSSLCVRNTYDETTCGLPKGQESNSSWVPSELRGTSNTGCTYYFTQNSCCCQGLAWVPDSPRVRHGVNTSHQIWLIIDMDERPTSVNHWDVRWYIGDKHISSRRILNDQAHINKGSVGIFIKHVKRNTTYRIRVYADGKFGWSSTTFNQAVH